MPDGIAIFNVTQRMYWTNMGNPVLNDSSIQSAKLDGIDVQTILQSGQVHTPKQLTIDQDASKLYFRDREGIRVMRCNLDGSEVETIYQSGEWKTEKQKARNATYWPVDIAISKKLNKFFRTQKGGSKASEGRMFSASLDTPTDNGRGPRDRSDVETIMEGLPKCIDLEIEDEEGIIYWTDQVELPLGNILNRKRIFGEGMVSASEKNLDREILAQGLEEGIVLVLDKAHRCVYVADMGGHMWKCHMDGGLKEKVYEGPTHAYTGLAYYKY